MKKCASLLLLLTFLLLLPACDPEDAPPVPEPTIFDITEVTFTTSSVILSEAPYSAFGAFGLNKNMDTAQRDLVTFAFESTISQDERAACIQATEAVLDRIGLSKPLQICVYAEGTYDTTFLESGIIYTSLQDWNSAEYITTLIQGVFGEYCSYGAAFGYANYLRQELQGTSMQLYEAGRTFSFEQDVLDLNLLCFRTAFFDGKDIKAAKKIANTFVSDYITAHGEAAFQALLVQSGTHEDVGEFCTALSDFYLNRGIDHTPSKILYRQGGSTYDYIVKTELATMYIQRDWVDKNMDLCPYTYEGFLHKNYSDAKEYFTRNTQDMTRYRQLFDLGPYNNDLAICFSNTAQRDASYNPNIHAIFLPNTGSLMSTYIRALTWEHTMQENWAFVGASYHFMYYYNHYGIAMSTVDYNASTRKCFVEFRENMGRDIDMAVDFAEIAHIFAYACSFDDPNDGGGFIAGSSFIGYLISRFGEEKVIEILFKTHDFGEYTYEELVADWQAFLQVNYSGYTKIK